MHLFDNSRVVPPNCCLYDGANVIYVQIYISSTKGDVVTIHCSVFSQYVSTYEFFIIDLISDGETKGLKRLYCVF